MGNCVASYAWRCRSGSSTIWSLRRVADGAAPRSLLTIEVDPRRATIVQVKGRRNRRAPPSALAFVGMWAERERLEFVPAGM